MPSVPVATRFFALLAIGSLLAVAGAVGSTLAARGSPAAARRRREVLEAVRVPATGLAALVAGVATAGSLYYSEVAGFPPCRLCWIQRGVMYPLAVVLLIGALTARHGVRRLVRFAAPAGAVVSAWHVAVERWPSLEGATCDPANPCSLVWVRDLGVFTIPAMALSAFALITVLSLVPGPQEGAE